MDSVSVTDRSTIRKVVLASASPRRQALMQTLALRLPLEIVAPDVDESTQPEWTPSEVVEQLALKKARAARELLQAQDDNACEAAVIIGADTIVVLDGEIMGKPKDSEDAIRTLQRLQGRMHEVYSGIACIHTADDREIVSYRVTRVHMKPLDSIRIGRYVASGEPLDKAGSYAIQGLGAVLVDGIDGCYFNVVGLSLSLLSELLLEFGIEVI
ncbi:Maf family protein [Paenibacillus abyssi]|uniref:dTTP/UTP pyrophosphatase n=1 Tax=Paenibacillus abyssi TaxID=1340531 RepID=A0A917LG56_9BACL|nr:Maf family protein [Paenibacillus abyssi]GGG20384.1 Maf-like protein [Paenibacillus abyssi]